MVPKSILWAVDRHTLHYTVIEYVRGSILSGDNTGIYFGHRFSREHHLVMQTLQLVLFLWVVEMHYKPLV